MKEIYIRYPITKKIEVSDEIYNLIERSTNGECPIVDDVNHYEYLWGKVKEFTDDEDMCELDFFRAHDGLLVAEFC